MASEIKFQTLRDDAFKKLDKDDYDKLKSNPDVFKKAEVAMKQTYDELKHMMSNSKSLDQALKHLPKERQERIKSSLRLQSFKVDIERKTDGSVHLKFASLQGKPLSFVPSVVTLTKVNYDENRTLLVARIVLEVIILLLDLIGIGLKLGEEAVKAAIEIIKAMLETGDSIIEDVNAMVEAEKEGSTLGLAQAIVKCMIDLFTDQPSAFYEVVKILLPDMAWYDILISVAKVAVFMVTFVATAGLAEIPEIVSFLLDASSFIKKLIQMEEFNSLKLDK